MSKKFDCADVGQTCGWAATTSNEEELLQKFQEHAKEHGYKEVTPELLAKIKGAIKDE